MEDNDKDFCEASFDIQANSIEAAIMYASGAHVNQKDKTGKPYILHPLRVMLDVSPDELAMKVAVLHDVVEDCSITLDDLREAGFAEDVVTAVDLVTRPSRKEPNRLTYRQYVQKIIDSKNETAIKVKVADTQDNLARVSELPEDQRSIVSRYNQTLRMFREALLC